MTASESAPRSSSCVEKSLVGGNRQLQVSSPCGAWLGRRMGCAIAKPGQGFPEAPLWVSLSQPTLRPSGRIAGEALAGKFIKIGAPHAPLVAPDRGKIVPAV